MGFTAIAWVGNTYMKFEDMCMEVEEAVRQAAITKYVEKQVKRVGTSIKRLCCDHASYDYLPPPPPSSEQHHLSQVATAAEFLQNPNVQYIKPVQDAEPISMTNPVLNPQMISSSDNHLEANSYKIAMQESNSTSASSSSRSMVETISRCISTPECREISADLNQDLEDETGSNTSMHMTELAGHESESESELGFEEPCVLVDGKDYVVDNHKQEEIRGSYKQKIQEAFCLKKKSGRKQEYKKEVDAEDKCVQQPNMDDKKSSTLESDWEVL